MEPPTPVVVTSIGDRVGENHPEDTKPRRGAASGAKRAQAGHTGRDSRAQSLFPKESVSRSAFASFRRCFCPALWSWVRWARGAPGVSHTLSVPGPTLSRRVPAPRVRAQVPPRKWPVPGAGMQRLGRASSPERGAGSRILEDPWTRRREGSFSPGDAGGGERPPGTGPAPPLVPGLPPRWGRRVLTEHLLAPLSVGLVRVDPLEVAAARTVAHGGAGSAAGARGARLGSAPPAGRRAPREDKSRALEGRGSGRGQVRPGPVGDGASRRASFTSGDKWDC